MDDYRFSDKRVRRAMTHAFDRPFVIKNVLNGLGTLTTGNFYRHSRAYNESIKEYKFDLSKAAELLEQAGWSDSMVMESEIKSSMVRKRTLSFQ